MKRIFFLALLFLPAQLLAQTDEPDSRVYGDLWVAYIDYDHPDDPSDGDTLMWGQGIDGALPGSLNGHIFFAMGYEDYGVNHTDVYHLRAWLSKPFRYAELGLGWSYWNNGFNSGGSNIESGPILTASFHSDPLTALKAHVGLDMVWCPVDLLDDKHYEFFQVDAGIGRDFGKLETSLGYRVKAYYDSPDDYLYQGIFAQLGIDF